MSARLNQWRLALRKSNLGLLFTFNTVAYIEKYGQMLYDLNVLRKRPLVICLKLMIALQLWMAVRFVLFALYPFCPVQRVVHFDILYMLHFEPGVNLLAANAFLVLAYAIRIIYFTYEPKLIHLQREIYIEHTSNFFLVKYRMTRNGLISMCQFCQCTVVRFLNCLQFFTLGLYLFDVFSHLVLIDQVRLQWAYFQSQYLVWSLFQILWAELQNLLFLADLVIISNVLLISALFFVSFTLVFFIKFDQIESVLKAPLGRKCWKRLDRLIRAHFQVVRFILAGNRLYGSTLIIYLVANLPPNLYLMAKLLVERFSDMGTMNLLFSVFFLSHQVVGVFGFHFVCALYTKRIHSFVPKRLIHFDSRLRYRSLRNHLKVALYIDRFHTTKCYGITYGKFGLVSINGFAKYLLIYAKFLFISYKVINQVHLKR